MIHEYNAKRYCNEAINLIENYEEAINDKNTTWDLHHIRELTPDCDFAYSRKDLKKMNLYYQRPANELVFLRHGEHIALHKKGKKLSAEHRAKIAESMMGKKLSDDTRKKLSESMMGKNKGSNHPLYGKTVSDETRAKISESMMGKNKGKKLSDETRAKISEAKKGKTVSAEHRKKLSEATTKYWQNRRKKKET